MLYKNVAVIGAGLIGSPIAKDLLAEGANVIVVARAESKSAKNLPSEIKVVSVALTDVAALAAVFKTHNIEVVVSTVAHEALPHQHFLADAAKQAEVKLFLPSELGFSTLGLTEGELGLKAKFGQYLEEISLPFTRIFARKAKILGEGDKKATFTHPDDIAGFVAYVVTHLPPSELHNRYFRIQGESASLLEIAGYYNLPVEHVTSFKADSKYSESDTYDPIKTFLHELINSGKGSVGYSAATGKELTGADAAGASNALWEGHHWKGIKEGLGI
ncbi:hypothetical protein HWV62_10311 [Athelia sp. TMB]|nr:hypothetical protein HWV62_10311 [Athelia sp. TMB]